MELSTWDQVSGTETGGVLGALTTLLSQYLPPRPLPPAVSGVPTAPRVPALGAMGPVPQRTTVASTSARSSGPGTARRPCVGQPTASSAPGRASACGRGSSRGRVSAEAWSLRGEPGGPGLREEMGGGQGTWTPSLTPAPPNLRGDPPHPFGPTHLRLDVLQPLAAECVPDAGGVLTPAALPHTLPPPAQLHLLPGLQGC